MGVVITLSDVASHSGAILRSGVFLPYGMMLSYVMAYVIGCYHVPGTLWDGLTFWDATTICDIITSIWDVSLCKAITLWHAAMYVMGCCDITGTSFLMIFEYLMGSYHVVECYHTTLWNVLMCLIL